MLIFNLNVLKVDLDVRCTHSATVSYFDIEPGDNVLTVSKATALTNTVFQLFEPSASFSTTFYCLLLLLLLLLFTSMC